MILSIIIPVFNSEKYLFECLNSVFNQNINISNFEVILIDDFSTDNSISVCNEFIKKGNVSVYRNNKNLGVAISRNIGVDKAVGDFIIFLDSDDMLCESSLSGLLDVINKDILVDVVAYNYVCQRYTNRGSDHISDDFYMSESVVKNESGIISYIKNFNAFPGVCWRYAINRNFIINKSLFFIPVRVHEDQEFVIRMLISVKKYSFYSGCVYWYRDTDDSLISSATQSVMIEDTIDLVRIIVSMSKIIIINSLTKLQKQFLYKKIKSTNNEMNVGLLVHSNAEIYKMSVIIRNNQYAFNAIQNFLHDFGYSPFPVLLDPYKYLLSRKRLLEKYILQLIDVSSLTKVIVFCATQLGIAVSHVMMRNNIEVMFFLDNNNKLINKTIMGYPIYTTKNLHRFPNSLLRSVFVFVCIEDKKSYLNIASQLSILGIKSNHVSHVSLEGVQNSVSAS